MTDTLTTFLYLLLHELPATQVKSLAEKAKRGVEFDDQLLLEYAKETAGILVNNASASVKKRIGKVLEAKEEVKTESELLDELEYTGQLPEEDINRIREEIKQLKQGENNG